jgi:hypothetical protein
VPAVFRLLEVKLGFDTQKPEPLLYQIILASSSTRDFMLDFFLGSGTETAVATRLACVKSLDIRKGRLSLCLNFLIACDLLSPLIYKALLGISIN